MNGRGLYGRNYVPLRSAPSPWATPWPPPWRQPPPPWAPRPPIFVGASEQALANAAAAPYVTGPVPAAVPAVPVVPAVAKQPDKGITVGSILKFGAIGALVIGGAVAASSLFTTVKKGKEPVRYYADLYREQSRGRR